MIDAAPDGVEALDLRELGPERRAESLRRAFRFLSDDEEFYVRGSGDPSRYLRVLNREFPRGVDWQPRSLGGGEWLARVSRPASLPTVAGRRARP